VNFAIDGIVSFSNAPLRLALALGFFVSITSFVYAIVAIILKLSGAFTVPGWTSIVFVASFLGGVQLIVLGVVGEYVGRIYVETKRRPLYIVNRSSGLKGQIASGGRVFVWDAPDTEEPASEDASRD
jgi:hypothetical protein